MIKRRFYKMEHGDRDDASNHSSSSSSDSDIQLEAQQADSSDDEDAVQQPCSDSSGYKSEDSSGNETLVDMSGFPIDDGNARESPKDDQVPGKRSSEFQETTSKTVSDKESPSVDLPEYVVKCKATFKCRICPRIVCLNEEALTAHLNSKRHARSEKLLSDGRLKTVLNSDGKIDEEEGPALYARILASSQAPRKKRKQDDKRKPRNKRMRFGNKKSKGH